MNSTKLIEKILNVYLQSGGEIRPHFFLTGPTGSGKTHTVTELADMLGIQLININCAQLTNEGLAGNSISKALAPLSDYQNTPIIIFMDEFDKAIGKESEVTSGAVQQEILKLIEDDTTEVFGNYGKYNRVQTSNILFIFAGSFSGAFIEDINDLTQHNVRPELLGRVGLHYHIERASLDALIQLVYSSELLKEYLKVFKSKDKQEAIDDIVLELSEQYKNNIIGVRIVNSLIHQYFINGKFISVTPKTPAKDNLIDLSMGD